MGENLKVLLVTGKRAEELVDKYSSQTSINTTVKVLPISIASFMNLNALLKELDKSDLEEFSMILIPGLAEFDLEKAEQELETPVFKGPKHAADIPFVLDSLDGLELSKEKSALELLVEELSGRAEELLREIEEKSLEDVDEVSNFRLGEGDYSVFVGSDFPPRVVAEINDAPRLSDDELVEVAGRYMGEGAEILDIGMTTEEEMSEEIPRLVSLLRDNFDVPLSIDTTNREEIRSAVEHGIDLVVSIDGSTIEDFEGLDVPAVIIPRDPDSDYYPSDPAEKMKYLESLLEKAEELDYDHPIGDPILEPVGRGFVDSFTVFHKLRENDDRIPLFMGIGNVIELYDADSIGISALLLGAAGEMNIDFVLTVEGSDKTRRNIEEVVKARNMMMLAKSRNSVPKDLGIDLLEFKEKRKSSDPYEEEIEKEAEVIQASPGYEFPQDEKGFFKIFTQESEIVAVFHSFEGQNVVIKGETAGQVSEEIVKRGLVSELSHAAYLGRELQKAEIAIRTGRGYIQEENVF